MRKEKRLWLLVLKDLEYNHKRGLRGICNLLMTIWYQEKITTDEYEFLKVRLRAHAKAEKIISTINQSGFFWPTKDLKARQEFIKKIIKTL